MSGLYGRSEVEMCSRSDMVEGGTRSLIGGSGMTMSVADAAAYATLEFLLILKRFWIAENALSLQACGLLHPSTDYAGRVTPGSSILDIVMFETISIVLRQAFASMTLGDHLFAKALKSEREIHVRENIKQPFLSF